MAPRSTFPSPLYAETVLAPNFKDFQRLFLESLLEIHYAHTLMLARQGIIPMASAEACLRALDELDAAELKTAVYDGRFEDVFFYVESRLEAVAGEEAGRMHTARSRNDIALTLYRMRLRIAVLEIAEALCTLCGTLLALAQEHVDTLIPAYTHTQPAQPTTLAHYLLGAIECFLRDIDRLKAAFQTINRSPLGACAITTTGFPIDRYFTAEVLGFEGLQLNSYGAIAATDYVTETAGVIATAMVNLGKFVQDLLLWCNPALNFLRLSDAWVQISSIMPQKRNPVALEHTRVLASKALAQAQGVFTMAHNTPFGDIVDSEDDLQPLVFSMTTDATRALRLFGGLLSDCEIDTARLEERAHADFLTVTELADTLVRKEGMSFHDAHTVVSTTVRNATDGMVHALRRFAPNVTLSDEAILEALDPRHFVDIRGIPGGPARKAVEPALAHAEAARDESLDWVRAKRQLLQSYSERVGKLRELGVTTPDPA